ncbi:hypothetical protein OHA77_13500 [Streptosporangium sp. NBC_01639]|uniref:hypothetical protein n=1 Tax=Streptosporangium sp. NBC_01639 TaxID=2975948 RepID=UPI00386C990B|nr:hypothetical protein OHA77_13500 [Streptosporangium sp. NBC_01639]
MPTLLVGGPLNWGTVTSAGLLVAHRPVEVAVAWLVLAAVVVGTCRRRPEAAGAWALAAGYLLVADGLLIMVSRAGSIQHALESRYIADATPVLAVCLALALMPWRDLSAPDGVTRRDSLRKAVASRRDPSGGERHDVSGGERHDLSEGERHDVSGGERHDPFEGERRDPSGGAGTVGSGNGPPPAVSPLVPVATCAYLALALVSAVGFAQGLPGGNRAYFEVARADLAALGPETGVYPSFVPDRMLFPWQAVEDRLTSRALSPLAEGALREKVRHPGAARRAVTFDDRGHLVPATVFGGYLTAKEGSCLPARNGTVVAEFPAAGAGNVARIDYRVTRDTRATVLSGDRRSEVLLRADWDRTYFPVPAASGPVRISVPEDGVCLRLATVGAAVPEGAGDGGPREVVSDGAG